MGAWVDSVESKARVIHDQLAAARSLSERTGQNVGDISRPYLDLLRRLYEEEFVFAQMADSADLVAHFRGPAVDAGDPAVSVVMTVFSDLRDQIRSIARSIVGLSSDLRLMWPSELDPHLAGVAHGSLVVGIKVPTPTGVDQAGQISLAAVSDPVYESVRAAVRSLAVIGRYVREDRVDDAIRDQFPDPAIRDTVMVAASRLAPTGRRGINRLTLYGPDVEATASKPLTPRSRAVLTHALARPVRVRGVGVFEGTVREIDLDARRFEIRNVAGVGALRCIYDPSMADLARNILDTRVMIRGSYETLENQQPRLLAVELIELIKPAPDQAKIPT